MEISEGKRKENRVEETSEVLMASSISKLMMDTKPQIQEAERTPR